MKVTKMRLILVAVCALFFFASRQGYAAPNIFTGIDPADNLSSPHPNSVIAAAAFDATASLLGPVNIITFEGSTVGSSSFTAAADVGVAYSGEYQNLPTGSGTYYSGVNTDNPLFSSNAWGFNTTTGGSQFIGLAPVGTIGRGDVIASIIFSFATPINAFGGYFTGLEDSPDITTLNYVTSGGSYSLEIMKPPAVWDDQGMRFFGIIDTDPITQITLTEFAPGGATKNDWWGLDDVRYASSTAGPAAVPEPSTFILLGAGLAGVAFLRRRIKA